MRFAIIVGVAIGILLLLQRRVETSPVDIVHD